MFMYFTLLSAVITTSCYCSEAVN